MAEDISAISDPKKVAEVERLLKFGRAGWYSLHSAVSRLGQNETYFDKAKIREIAMSKLLSIPADAETKFANQVLSSCNGPIPRETSPRLLAVLATRLCLTPGPSSAEAIEMVSSHLAVLLHSDEDRHFINTYYPSEPIVAEASAELMHQVGWGPHLRALYQQIRKGIVTTDYRGVIVQDCVPYGNG